MSAWSNPTVPYLFTGSDKVMHAGLYAVLGMGLGFGRVRSLVPPPHLVLIFIGMLYGATDEFHQVFVRGRTPDWSDWVADIVGVMCGYLLIVSLLSRRKTSASVDHGVDASR
ncbi:MAG: VanZ family protein [Gemmatimonadales bacterium]